MWTEVLCRKRWGQMGKAERGEIKQEMREKENMNYKP